jgi:hypothetical protein
LYQDGVVKIDPAGQESEVRRVEFSSDNPDGWSDRDRYHLGWSDLGAMRDLDPNIVPGAAFL